ncbi:hypothetical protein FACS1894219_00790 [Clostridia bacterium]|nr:hypothetical protein FACS1894219_00790 [Clostridia bacterium]
MNVMSQNNTDFWGKAMNIIKKIFKLIVPEKDNEPAYSEEFDANIGNGNNQNGQNDYYGGSQQTTDNRANYPAAVQSSQTANDNLYKYDQGGQPYGQNQGYGQDLNSGFGSGQGGDGGIGITSVQQSPDASVELVLVNPDECDDVARIADHLLHNKTVVLNLENTNKETARRLYDYLSGVAYAIKGQLKRTGEKTLIITPKNASIISDKSTVKPPKSAAGDTSPYGNI